MFELMQGKDDEGRDMVMVEMDMAYRMGTMDSTITGLPEHSSRQQYIIVHNYLLLTSYLLNLTKEFKDAKTP